MKEAAPPQARPLPSGPNPRVQTRQEFTQEDVAGLLSLVNGPRPRTSRLDLAWVYLRLGLTYLTSPSLVPSPFERQLMRLRERLDAGELHVGNVESLARSIDKALNGDEGAYRFLENWLSSRPHLLERETPGPRRRRPLPPAVVDYIASVNPEPPSPLELEARRLGLL